MAGLGAGQLGGESQKGQTDCGLDPWRSSWLEAGRRGWGSKMPEGLPALTAPQPATKSCHLRMLVPR